MSSSPKGSPTRLAHKVKCLLHINKVNLDPLDPENNPNITECEERESKFTDEVAYCRNWYFEVYLRKRGPMEYEAPVRCLFRNEHWSFDQATNHHQQWTENDRELAPEEVIEDGVIHPSEQWVLEHQYAPTKVPSEPTKVASTPVKDRVHHLVSHVKNIARRRSRSLSTSSHSGGQRTPPNTPPRSAPLLSDSGAHLTR